MTLHPFQLRWLAEDLTRLRRADDRDRYAAAHRGARIDANPHQIDAVIFALRRIPEGGCILADEVGLGKTIEAGLVIAQSRVEGFTRILLVVPKPLLGQWQSELGALFGITGVEVRGPAFGAGVFIVGREQAGSAKGQAWLRAAPWDLVVIDEAHELFAGIWRRFDRYGFEDPESPDARSAAGVRTVIGAAPVLLLTATPIQNTLAELWGLVQFVEPTNTLFGDLPTFRRLFCASGDERAIAPGQEQELQRRIATVCQRTLRRQAQEFLDRPFVERHCRLFQYDMGDEERALYEDVTDWLMRPRLHAFSGRTRTLLRIGFLRRMASSSAAFAASLDQVAARLRAMVDGAPVGPLDRRLFDDLDDLELADEAEEVTLDVFEPERGPDPRAAAALASGSPAVDPAGIAAELALVVSFADRARALPSDAKARAFEEAIRIVLERGRDGRGSGKAVVFTESLTTQAYLRDLLVASGLDPGDVTLFQGTNDDARAREALASWRETPIGRADRASPAVQVRTALVHEFKTRSKVLICTEAGAKGLNLQFAETVVNYDLPWNPQRIEQRIGRCHRYGQQRAVVVVNFLARDNAASQLTFEILSQKLDLFGRVLDASDAVLHEPRSNASPDAVISAVAMELEGELRRIHDQARSAHEVARDLVDLRERIGERRRVWEDQQRRTSALIESRFDAEVRQVFVGMRDELAKGLARLDADVARLVGAYLAAEGRGAARADAPNVFDVDGRVYIAGDPAPLPGAEALGLDHPLTRAALGWARAFAGGEVTLAAPIDRPDLVGRTGALAVVKVAYGGFEPVERLVVAASIDGAPIEPALAVRLIHRPALRAEGVPPEPAGALQEAIDEALFLDQRAVEAQEQSRFERAMTQLERHVDDRARISRAERLLAASDLERARKRRDEAVGSDNRARASADVERLDGRIAELDARISTLEDRDDPEYDRWRARHHARRYAPPTATPILQISFRLVSGGSP